MKRFLLLYSGRPVPPGASHEEWPAWFDRPGHARMLGREYTIEVFEMPGK